MGNAENRSFYFLLGPTGKEKLEGLLLSETGLAGGCISEMRPFKKDVTCLPLLLQAAYIKGPMDRCSEVIQHTSPSHCWLQALFWPVPRRAYTASLGETAVAFDFGPLVPVPKNVLGQRGSDEVLAYPLYILYENGETFLTYISLIQR